MKKQLIHSWLILALVALLLGASGCDRLVGSKVNRANYDKITVGMAKSQVETILGPPTKVETTDMIIFKKTTWRYENGARFAIITFKNDEVDGKDTNLSR
jgi:outer membrane protein assembly factor BamE (lipoprotein component of BamABCDE complex)